MVQLVADENECLGGIGRKVGEAFECLGAGGVETGDIDVEVMLDVRDCCRERVCGVDLGV